MISQQTHMSTDEQIVILIPVYNDWTSVTQLIFNLDQSLRDTANKVAILLVDDGDYNLMTLRTILEFKFQIIPDEAQNGQIAIDMFKAGLDKECKCPNRAYKLILMDI